MQVTVYHHDFPFGPDRLTAVARVTAPDDRPLAACEFAYVATQNIGGSWSREATFEDGSPNEDYRPEIERLAPLHVEGGQTYGLRSSMMGDVMELEDGQRFRVAAIGFDPLPATEAAR